MKLINGVHNMSEPLSPSVLTIGNFDGVHLGHRALISRLVARAKELGLPAIVMTFDPHPVKFLYPDRKLHRIFSFDDQRLRLEELGVDVLIVEPFSREFSQLSPERFLQEWVIRPFSPETIVVGYDFSFGARREGSIEFLKSRAVDFAYRVEVFPPVKVMVNKQELLVSSSRIRQALETGDVRVAALLLGRKFHLEGLVEKGVGRGRTIGIPTANLRTLAECVPARGVYCGWALVHGRKWKAVANIGSNPTFNSTVPTTQHIEVHLLGFTGDIYGEEVVFEFVDRLRDEKKFSGANELVQQIRQDIIEGERRLDSELK